MTRLYSKHQSSSAEDNRVYSKIFMLLVFVLLGLLGVKTIHNPDFFWHVKVGEDIIRTFAIPIYDSYSYHEGLRFFAHEWFFDVLISSVHSNFGMYGVLAFMQMVGVAISFMIYKNLRLNIEKDSFSIFMCFCIAGLFISSFLVPRPQMISSLLALIVFYLMERWFGDNSTAESSTSLWMKRYVILALISVLWINIHGGSYPLFFIILSGYGLEKLIVFLRSRDRKDLNSLWRVISFGVCALLAFCINPYGIKMLTFPLLLTGDPTTYFIQEWKSPVFHGFVGIIRFLIYIFPLFVLLNSRKSIRLRTKVYVFLFTFMALSSIRHMSLLVLFNYICIAPHFYSAVSGAWSSIVNIIENIFRRRRVAVTVVAILTVVMNIQTWSTVTPLEWSEYPIKALAYIEEQGIDIDEGNLFNRYGWGGYMIFTGHRVFIDGRADVYQEKINPQSQVINDYLDIIHLVNVDVNLNKYDCRYVLHLRNGTLATYLKLHPDWVVLFESEEENSVLLSKE